jgi:hypothetical protein
LKRSFARQPKSELRAPLARLGVGNPTGSDIQSGHDTDSSLQSFDISDILSTFSP